LERVEIKIGYAHVSTEDQWLTLQLDALNQAGCTKVSAKRFQVFIAIGPN